jgi:hypothetical protein
MPCLLILACLLLSWCTASCIVSRCSSRPVLLSVALAFSSEGAEAEASLGWVEVSDLNLIVSKFDCKYDA